MSDYPLVKRGLYAIRDTGPPPGVTNYTTLVVLHGTAWHSGIFARFLPIAHAQSARVVLVQLRGYPEATPFTDTELQLLASTVPATPEAAANIETYMKARARELYDFLGEYVAEEDLPVEGGVVLSGWSFGTIYIMAFLAHVAGFPVGRVDLRKYIRRAISYDSPSFAYGYAPPPDSYSPLRHPSLAPGEGAKLFPKWVSGYYDHGSPITVASLEHRNALATPQASIVGMTPDDLAGVLYSPPSVSGASDNLIMMSGIKHGMYATLKERAFYPEEGEWAGLEFRYVWCDHSVWEMPYTKLMIEAELEEAKKLNKRTREIKLVRLREANHFAHWDQPERTLKVLLGDNVEEEGGE